MITVGYGDISPKTVIEKIYVILDKDFMKFRLKTNFIWNFF